METTILIRNHENKSLKEDVDKLKEDRTEPCKRSPISSNSEHGVYRNTDSEPSNWGRQSERKYFIRSQSRGNISHVTSAKALGVLTYLPQTGETERM